MRRLRGWLIRRFAGKRIGIDVLVVNNRLAPGPDTTLEVPR